jgi:hypothetical protein
MYQLCLPELAGGPYNGISVLNITCTYSGLCFLFCHSAPTVEAAAVCIEILIPVLWDPKHDNRRQRFLTRAFPLYQWHSKRCNTPPFSPTSNSIVERMNRLVDKIIKRKQLHISGITALDILEVQYTVNMIPRRLFNNLAPLELLLARDNFQKENSLQDGDESENQEEVKPMPALFTKEV